MNFNGCTLLILFLLLLKMRQEVKFISVLSQRSHEMHTLQKSLHKDKIHFLSSGRARLWYLIGKTKLVLPKKSHFLLYKTVW